MTGWTKDIIAERAEYKMVNYTFHDDYGAFYSTGVQTEGAIADETRMVTTNNGTQFKLAPYDESNALPMANDDTYELKMVSPTSAAKLHFLAFSPMRKPKMEVIANYEDGTKSEAVTFSLPYSHIDELEDNEGKGEAVFGLGIYDNDRTEAASSWDGYYNLYEYEMEVDQSKKIKSLSVRRSSTMGTPILLAVSNSKVATSIKNTTSGKNVTARKVVGIYNLNGMKVERTAAGLYIIKYSDGSSKKVMLKK